MITLHRLGHSDEPFQLNPDMIVTVESTPDTVITLATGAKVVVAETPAGGRRSRQRLPRRGPERRAQTPPAGAPARRPGSATRRGSPPWRTRPRSATRQDVSQSRLTRPPRGRKGLLGRLCTSLRRIEGLAAAADVESQ